MMSPTKSVKLNMSSSVGLKTSRNVQLSPNVTPFMIRSVVLPTGLSVATMVKVVNQERGGMLLELLLSLLLDTLLQPQEHLAWHHWHWLH